MEIFVECPKCNSRAAILKRVGMMTTVLCPHCRYLFDTVVDDYENALETARDAVRRLYEMTEDKYCDNCFFLKVDRTDSYKCFCNRFNVAWTHHKEENFPRQLICLLEGK